MTAADYVLHHGDCIEVMATMAPGSIDAIVCDPPYGLGFMGKAWDDLPPSEPWARECLRVLKPGGHLLAFGGTRTSHRLAVAIEDAGFEIRDALAWMHGQGFPKGKAQLKPAYEPIIMARKPFVGSMTANVAVFGTGGLQIDAARVQYVSDADRDQTRVPVPIQRNDARGVYMSGTGVRRTGDIFEPSTAGRWPANVVLDESQAAMLDEQSGTSSSLMRIGKRTGKASTP